MELAVKHKIFQHVFYLEPKNLLRPLAMMMLKLEFDIQENLVSNLQIEKDKLSQSIYQLQIDKDALSEKIVDLKK